MIRKGLARFGAAALAAMFCFSAVPCKPARAETLETDVMSEQDEFVVLTEESVEGYGLETFTPKEMQAGEEENLSEELPGQEISMDTETEKNAETAETAETAYTVDESSAAESVEEKVHQEQTEQDAIASEEKSDRGAEEQQAAAEDSENEKNAEAEDSTEDTGSIEYEVETETVTAEPAADAAESEEIMEALELTEPTEPVETEAAQTVEETLPELPGTLLEASAIDTFAMKITWPKAGGTIAEARASFSYPDSANTCKLTFSTSSGGAAIPDSTVLQGGQTYYVRIEVTLKNTWYLSSSTKITLNGKELSLNIPAGTRWTNFNSWWGERIENPDLSKLEDFVDRFYVDGLGRDPEPAGRDHWVNLLYRKQLDGAGLALKIFESAEFTSKGHSDDAYVNRLYLVLLGRHSDSGGRAHWVSLLENGMSRRFVLASLIASEEFRAFCASADINRGTVTLTENRDWNSGVTALVCRFYTKALDRTFDVSGLNYWTGGIRKASNRRNHIITAAQSFFLSQEFKNHRYSNEETLLRLYRVFMDREADTGGLNYWIGVLNKGTPLSSVISSFANSPEFKKIMAGYGVG